MFSLDREKDTICALASAPGSGALAIIRMSGDRSLSIIKKLFSQISNTEVRSHQVYYGFLRNPVDNALIDEVMVTYFESGRSFTGETSVEISCHGNPVIVNEILRVLIEQGARAADPGEFTYRAFSNGRIDLVQAESVLNVIQSRTKSAARVALRQLQGGLSSEVESICENLTWALSRLEANLDFSSEDIEFATERSIFERLDLAKNELSNCVNSFEQGRKLVSGVRVALVGAPNVGKSSLLNALINEDRAIVSEMAGTTRDTIEADIIIDGTRFVFVDTAGLRDSADEIERLGVERSRNEIDKADVVLLVRDLDASSEESWPLIGQEKVTVKVLNKSDLLGAGASGDLADYILVSAKTNQGLGELRTHLSKMLGNQISEESAAVLSVRQFEMLSEALDFVERGLALFLDKASPEFVISELQGALKVVLRVLGKEFDDEVLDRVFRDFCLGK